ncbi:MAG TPA: hypothetical protein DCG49_10615 [Ruminococcus sp.]|nr:hypothetical protein [Ruminococcus sp.]
MEKAKQIIRKYLPAAAFAAALLWLLYQIYPVIFATHDDMRNYTIVREGSLFQLAWEQAVCGRISQLWNTLLLGIPFLADKVWFYKAIAYACLLFDIGSCRLLLKAHVSKPLADMSAILIVSWACLSNYHNMLVSYALCHQLPIAFLFLSLYFFGNTLKKPSKKQAALSALFLLLACMIYEAFLPAVFLFAGWSLLHESAKEQKCSYFAFLKKASRRILPHLSVLAGYMMIYYGWRHFYPTRYDGTSFSFQDPFMSLLTALFYAISFFPVTEMMNYTKRSPVPLQSILEHISVAAWIVSALTAAAFAILLPRMKTDKRKLFACSLLSGVGVLIPVLVISLTPKYPDWIRRGAIGYLPSYYSFFFLVIFIAVGMVRLYTALPDKHYRTTVRVFLTAAVFFVSLTANAVTSIWRPYFDIQSLRYRNFQHAVSTEPVCVLDTSWQIYAPDNPGIHLDKGLTEKFLQLYNPNQVDYLKADAPLSDAKQTLVLRMPENYSYAVLGAADHELCADSVTVRTLVPDAQDIILYDTDGNAVEYDGVHDGDVLRAPDGSAFDLNVRTKLAPAGAPQS